MAKTENTPYNVQGHTRFIHARIAAAGTYYKGAIMVINPSTGYAVAAADTATYGRLVGILTAGVTVESGSVEDVSLEVGRVWIPFESAALTHIGTYVYATADDTISATATNADPIGIVEDVEVGTEVLVNLDRAVPKTALA